MNRIVLFVVVTILYGSFYPFHFEVPPGGIAEAFRIVANGLFDLPGRGDIVQNILLYIPLGFFLRLTEGRLSKHPLTVLAGAALSVFVEISQSFFPGRDPNFFDLVNNTLGTAVGAVGASMIRLPHALPGVGSCRANLFPLLLSISWMSYNFAPFVPTIDLQKWKNAVKPLIGFHVDLAGTLHHAVGWTVLIMLAGTVFGKEQTTRIWLVLVPTIFAAKIMVVALALSPKLVCGLAIAVAVTTLAPLRRVFCSNLGAFIALAASILINGLDDVFFDSPVRTFNWTPFGGFLAGSPIVNSMAMLEKFFLYGSLVWLAFRMGLGIFAATFLGVAITGTIEVMQMWSQSHTSEITDSLVVVVAAFVMRAVDSHPVFDDGLHERVLRDRALRRLARQTEGDG